MIRRAEPCPQRIPGCLKTRLTQTNSQGLERGAWWTLVHSWKTSWRRFLGAVLEGLGAVEAPHLCHMRV